MDAQKKTSVPFVEMFTKTTLGPDAKVIKSEIPSSGIPHYAISQVEISPSYIPTKPGMQQAASQVRGCQIRVKRKVTGKAVISVGVFDACPKGWLPLSFPSVAFPNPKNSPYFLLGPLTAGQQHVTNIYIEQVSLEKAENTQPTISSPEESEDLIWQGTDWAILLKVTKQKVEQKKYQETVHFEPHTEALLMKSGLPSQELKSLSKLCYPQGLRVFSKPSGFKFYSFIITTMDGERLYCYCLSFREKCTKDMHEKLQNIFGNTKQFYVQATFSLISQYLCTDQVSICMENLYRVYLAKQYNKFIDVINKLPFTFTKEEESPICRFNEMEWKLHTSYPTISTNSLYCLFKFLTVQNILRVVQGLLMEENVFLVSTCKNILGYAIEAFLSFIYPLKWNHIILSLVPQDTLEYAENPFTALIGLSPEQAEAINHSSGIMVYLDQNTVIDKRDKQLFLPQPPRNRLLSKLKRYQSFDTIDVRDYLNNPENVSVFKTQKFEDPHFNPYHVRNIFLEMMILLLKDYNQFYRQKPSSALTDKIERKSIRKVYDFHKIKKAHKNEPFLREFFSCALFAEFVTAKYENPDHKWVKFFDKTLKKMSKHFVSQHISEQSEIFDSEDDQEIIPTGCFHRISIFSKDSQEEKKSPPGSQKKQQKNEQKFSEQKSQKQVSQTEDDNPQEIVVFGTTEQIKSQEGGGNRKIVYVDDPVEGASDHLCLYFTFPYRKIKESKVGKSIGNKMKDFKNWVFRQKSQKKSQQFSQ